MVKVHRLRPENDRRSFDCGNAVLDRFLAEFALQNMRSRVGVTYVAEELGVVLGYVTVTGCSIRREDVRRSPGQHLPRYPLPALRVARLAVDRRFQRQGVGTLLVGAALDMAVEMSESTGCVSVLVDAKPDSIAFYERLGFEGKSPVDHASASRPLQTPMDLPVAWITSARDL